MDENQDEDIIFGNRGKELLPLVAAAAASAASESAASSPTNAGSSSATPTPGPSTSTSNSMKNRRKSKSTAVSSAVSSKLENLPSSLTITAKPIQESAENLSVPDKPEPQPQTSSSASTAKQVSPPPPAIINVSSDIPLSNSLARGAKHSEGLESTIEKLKKRKALHAIETTSPIASQESGGKSSSGVEILAMDKEVTLTRLPKRPRLTGANGADITPVVQRLGANPSISVRTLFPGEEEMSLHANIDFSSPREVTPHGWEKSACVIQYDRDTKMLWQELQRPYGNQSSFLRHLVLLEKYYRSGDLILAPNASRNAINYSTSVQNRLISYEGPEKMDVNESAGATLAPTSETTTSEFANPSRMSGGIMVERSTEQQRQISATVASQLSRLEPSTKVLKLTPGVSIIKKPPPNLQRLNISITPTTNGSARRKDSTPMQKSGTSGSSLAQSLSQGVKMFKVRNFEQFYDIFISIWVNLEKTSLESRGGWAHLFPETPYISNWIF